MANKATLTSTRMIAMALPSAPEPFSSRDPAADERRGSARGAQTAPCSAKAMVKAMSTRCARLVRQLGVGRDDVGRREDHEGDAGLGEHAADDAAPAERHRDRARDAALADAAQDQHDRDDGRRRPASAEQQARRGWRRTRSMRRIAPSMHAVSWRRAAAAIKRRAFARPLRRLLRGTRASRPRRDDSHLRARGRSIPSSGSRGSSFTASISAGWT